MEPSVSRSRDKFIYETIDYGVNQKAIRCYVQRAEEYIKAHPDRRLKTHSPELVTRTLEEGNALGESLC